MLKIILIGLMFPILLLVGCALANDMLENGSEESDDTTDSTESTPEDIFNKPPDDSLDDLSDDSSDEEYEDTPDIDDDSEQDHENENNNEQYDIPSFGFIDAHADTITRALLRDPGARGLYINNTLDVDFSRLAEFGAPVQIFALWLSDRYVAAGFERTDYMIDFFIEEVAKHSDIIEIALDLEDIIRIAGEGKISAVLSIEGGEALMGKIENLDHFYERGVRIFAPVWNRENDLGFGQATGSSIGLKPFGIEVIQRMDELGMILDVSHLNEAGFWDAHNTSTRPYMASHSNAYSVMPHDRNLKDDQITAIVESGGLIGFNMFPAIIASGNRVTLNDVSAHFKHFFDIGAGDHIGLGCDLDGIPSMPAGFSDVSSLKMFGEFLTEEFGEERAFNVMEGNFYRFFKRYFDSGNIT